MRYSVIVPIYNTEKYLPQCIDSILGQTFGDFELILVDDGSTDGSSKICDEYAEKDDRIVVVHKGNGGLISARKAGANCARGQYVALVDGDDWVSENWLQEVQTVLTDKPNVDVVCYDYYWSTTGSNRPVQNIFPYGHYDKTRLEKEIYPRLLRDEQGNRFPPNLAFKVFTRDKYLLYQNQVDERIRIGEDECVALACVYAAESIYILDRCLYYYRQNENSMTKTRAKGYPWLDIQLRKKWHERFLPMDRYGFQDQLNRLIINDLFTYAKSHFRTKRPYQEIKKEIIAEFSREEYQDAIKECEYKKNWKKSLATVAIRHRQIFIIYLYAKIFG